MHMYRTHNCNELNLNNVGASVKLSGFIKTVRDLGAVMFIDLRDHFGITQLLVNDSKILEELRKVPVESTICIEGTVLKRDLENVNDVLETGEIEVCVCSFQVLGKVENLLPFKIEDSKSVREDLRLEYRFLDLRNEKVHEKIVFRAKMIKTLRDKMDELGFTEIQTPILANSSPEGARDFLVPSRIHEGEFYALPQAPQQFKQLLMMSGFDKYYQIAPCFRDEDPRSDRLPGEFYQLDFEMAFVEEADVLKVLEIVAGDVFEKLGNKKVTKAPFTRFSYKEAMDKFGTDKPDLRNPLEIEDVTKAFENTEFKIFKGKTIKAIKVPTKNQTRKFFDSMVDFAISNVELKGLAWIKYGEDENVSGTISKFITPEVLEYFKENLKLQKEDGVFFIADGYKKACEDAGKIRIELGQRLELLDKSEYKLCFVKDFPMYELDDDGKIAFNHNPFSMPVGGLESLNTKSPLDVLAHQFDLVCNGYEIASGAVRNHEVPVMLKAFELAGYTKKDVEKRFGSLFNAFQYGAPPHAGAAPGIDRIMMLLTDETNIREVVAFPKNGKARDLLMRAPSVVTKQQLEDVHVKIIESKNQESKNKS
ncbi:MAG: aspartate--tRNA ligase [Clostridia bacterium]